MGQFGRSSLGEKMKIERESYIAKVITAKSALQLTVAKTSAISMQIAKASKIRKEV